MSTVSFKIDQKDGKWVVLNQLNQIVASFDRQDQAFEYADRKETKPIWKRSKTWNWGEFPSNRKRFR